MPTASRVKLEGAASTNLAEVVSSGEIKAAITTTQLSAAPVNWFSENDKGNLISGGWVFPPEVEQDFRERLTSGYVLDEEVFNYTAQNTGKHNYGVINVGLATWTTGGLVFNKLAFAGFSDAVYVGTWGYFSARTPESLTLNFTMSFGTLFPTAYIGEFGFFRGGGGGTAPTDGAFFRITSYGIQGIVSFGGNETSTGVLPASQMDKTPFSYIFNRRYQFTIQITQYCAFFWIRDAQDTSTSRTLFGVIPTPIGQGRSLLNYSYPVAFTYRARIGSMSFYGYFPFILYEYSVRRDGNSLNFEDGNRLWGSYQGLSGGTMGSLASYANSANPSAAAGSNTATLVTGLGGQVAVNARATDVTDIILTSYQNPTLRRLKITSVKISAINMGAVVATTPTLVALSLCFGHTAVSLATVETTAVKAPRRISLGQMFWPVGAVIGAQAGNGDIVIDFTQGPVYVNPSEFISVACKFLVGTATASQAIWFHITPVYTWE